MNGKACRMTLSVETGSKWNSLVVQLPIKNDADVWNYLRLTLTEGLAKDQIQIGRVVITGYNH